MRRGTHPNSHAALARSRALRWRGRLPIPAHSPRLVRHFFLLMNAKRATIAETAERAGMRQSTISDWRYRHRPLLECFEAALNALGYRLAIVPLDSSPADAMCEIEEGRE